MMHVIPLNMVCTKWMDIGRVMWQFDESLYITAEKSHDIKSLSANKVLNTYWHWLMSALKLRLDASYVSDFMSFLMQLSVIQIYFWRFRFFSSSNHQISFILVLPLIIIVADVLCSIIWKLKSASIIYLC